jgi:hypothetical protein
VTARVFLVATVNDPSRTFIGLSRKRNTFLPLE